MEAVVLLLGGPHPPPFHLSETKNVNIYLWNISRGRDFIHSAKQISRMRDFNTSKSNLYKLEKYEVYISDPKQ